MTVGSTLGGFAAHADWDGWLLLTAALAACWVAAIATAASLFSPRPRDGHEVRSAAGTAAMLATRPQVLHGVSHPVSATRDHPTQENTGNG
ncbi:MULTISPECIES: hypothetical protein [Mycolicibacterium]|uniref:Uncharacterized protein n=1 Tax=Mycolicibacterium fortuitum TaxID=1766 RepID=A0AAE5AGM1_MYCFO|nr:MULTISPECIES: hypothetical protein [Mycolicibacterium]MCA4725246.1 hypothetical protein [Mycolicibacterium fortuitum]MDG5769356.1 hypothetical protein [Mycolicibacterium fortuitum]MDG5785004.1 hypothetical protein [Mycolicibacterium fortuitum]MDV7195586.1 hypothetical protein [Mycolicibacterium fortuitum]MDV7209245.1 hypothetical protein [Mycolicibacterium fortuitum]